MAVVGIDLGTTNTVIAAVRDGRATALKDKLGRALLPSVVSFSPSGKRKVGYEAKDRRTIDPENTVFSIKRLIGRTFDSEHVQKAIQRLPFELKEGPGKSTLVSCYGADFTLPEISAMVLEQAQLIGQARLGTDVSDAVITVPANFNDLQRAATKVAGRTAGLEVLRIINEPTAAALAYGFGKTTRERIAVYDFGGGTFDVTLLDLSDNVFEVLATAGDTFLGGDDIDLTIMDRMAEELLKKNKVDASGDNLVREQLRAAAEKLKIDLSTRSMGKSKIEELDFEFTLRRSEFEKLAEPLLKRTLEVCQEAMDVAGIANKDLDQILLVGGSTRIPLVRRRISSFFGKMPQSRINPDEVVAIGAAIQASSLEAKQGASASLPAAPRPRGSASQHPSRAPAPLGSAKGTTKTGLAGLTKTLAGQGASEAPSQVKASTLTGIKSVPPTGQKLGPAATMSGVGPDHAVRPSSPPVDPLSDAPRGKHKTLAGVGGEDEPRRKMATLAGVGDEKSSTLSGLSDRQKGSTNLGLGATPSSPPPIIGQPPPSVRWAQPNFDDETSLNEGAALIAAELDKRARASKDEGRRKFETLPGAASPPGGGDDETTDGSVTFDLDELERLHGGADDFADLESEATAVVDPEMFEARAAQLDSQVDNDLPEPVRNEPEELGGSALIDLSEEEDEEIADLPSPASRAPEELGGSALIDILDVDDEQVDLPSPRVSLGESGTGLPDPAEAELPELLAQEAGLPVVGAGLPVPAGNLPSLGRNLPARGGNLPAKGGNLPARAEAGLPQTKSGEHRLGLGKTQIAAPGGGPNFGDAIDNAPKPSVEELDELSVAAILPEEEDDEAEFDLSHPGLDSLRNNLGGGTAPLGGGTLGGGLQGATPQAGGPVLGAKAPDPGRISTIEDSVAKVLSQRPEPSPQAPVAAPTRGPLLLDVTPLSLGVEVIGGYVDKLIERNSPIPCENTRTFATARDNQAMVRVRVSQGEEERFERNTLLGEVELTGLSQGPRGSVKVDVSFSLDESGMLQVSARDTATGNAADARLMLVGVASSNQ